MNEEIKTIVNTCEEQLIRAYTRDEFLGFSPEKQQEIMETMAAANMSRSQISSMTGLAPSSANQLLAKFGIETQGRRGRPPANAAFPITMTHFKIGQKINEYLTKAGWQPRDLASVIGETGTFVNQILRGIADARLSTYIDIADAFEIHVEDLFEK